MGGLPVEQSHFGKYLEEFEASVDAHLVSSNQRAQQPLAKRCCKENLTCACTQAWLEASL